MMMKITQEIVKQFEIEQKEFGSRVALENVIWNVAYSLLKDIGVIGITTRYRKKRK